MNGRRAKQQRRLLEATLTATVKAGDFVSWRASKGEARGKIVSVHTSSKVPGLPYAVNGTDLVPAARVRLYAKSGNGWVPTETFVGHTANNLTSIDPLPEPATEAAVAGSFDDIRTTVQDAISDRAEQFGGRDYVYVNDIGPDWVVYQFDFTGDLWMCAYTMTPEGVVTLSDPTQVTKVTMYVPEQPAVDGPTGDTFTEAADRLEGRLLGAKGVDDTGSRVFRVQILAYGDSKNGRRYSESVMRAAAPLYEGAKAYDHHRTNEELTTSTLKGLVGTYRNVEATGTGLEADLHLLPGSTHVAEALDQSLVNQTAGLSPLVGISHDVMALYKPIIANGRKLVEASQILSVNSADVVADPAAGGHATRMVAGGIDPTTNNPHPHPKGHPTVNLKRLLELLRAAEAAKRPELLEQHADVITAAGLEADDVLRMAEALPAPGRSTEATLSPLMARHIVNAALTEAKLDLGYAEAIILGLGDQVTESAIVAQVATHKRVLEGAELAGLRPRVEAKPEVVLEERDKMIGGLDKLLAGDYSMFRSLKEAFIAITGADIRGSAFDSEDLNRRILRESATIMIDGERVMYDSGMAGNRSTESVASSTWGNILGDSITRRMVALYATPNLSSWRGIVSSIIPVNDFRTQRIERMGGYGVLPAVLQGAPYQPLTTPANDTEVTYAVSKRGGTEDLTLETIANDDLRAVQRIPQLLGLAAAQTLFRFVWELVSPTTNPTLFDSVALYHATHANTAASALSQANLSTIRKKMRIQAAYGDTSNILGLVPQYLVVPPDLEELAWEICTSSVAMPSGAPVGAASNIPNLHQGMTPIVLDYWSAQSTTGWIVVADPSMCPTIELGFYQGQQDPALFVQSDPTVGSLFNADKITYKIRHIYSGAVLDFRGFQRGNA